MFVTKMPVVRIVDLAYAMIEMLAPRYGYDPQDIKVNVIGSKPGEKLYEELMSEEECYRSQELKDMFVVTPAFRAIYHNIDYTYDDMISGELEKPYVSSSESAMHKQEIIDYLSVNKVLEKVEEASFGGL